LDIDYIKQIEMVTILKSASSEENEFYFGGSLGVIQYEITMDELREGLTSLPQTDDYKKGFKLADHSPKNLARLVPDTETGRAGVWAPLLVMKKKVIKENGEKEVWLKAALINKNTGNVSLITSTNSHENIGQHGNRWVSSQADDWVVGRYRMFAPLYFWEELANRL
jgi:hypothetical protein